MKSKLKLIIPVFLIIASSCDMFNSGDQEGVNAVARVYESHLYREDLQEIVPDGLTGKDSIAFVQNYINVWAKSQLMLYKAEYNLPEDQKDFEDQIRNYRNDLLKFAYEQQYVEQNLDTNIQEAEIAEFYANNADNFHLRENIIKAYYIIMPQDAPQLEEAKGWFRSDDPEDRAALKEHALKYAREFSLEDSGWASFDVLMKKLPIEVEKQAEYLENNKIIEVSDSTTVYLIEIVDYKLKEDLSPLTYVQGIIRNIILNRRKLELLAELEKSLLDDAIDKKEFETY